MLITVAVIFSFLAIWIGFATFGRKKQWSKIASIGGGFILGCVSIIIITYIAIPNPPQKGDILKTASNITIEITDIQTHKNVKNGMLVMGKVICPRNILPNQIKPAALEVIDDLKKRFYDCAWFMVWMSDDNRSYNAGNYIATAEYKEGNVSVRGGIPSDQEIAAVNKSPGELSIRKPDDLGLDVYLAFRKIKDTAYKNGKYLSDDEVYPRLSRQFNLPVSKIREIHMGIACYYMYKMGNKL